VNKYQSREDLYWKIDWEGGPDTFFLDYGMDPDDAPDEEIARLVRQINNVANEFGPLLKHLMCLLEPE
jgi:hypothetical protein